MSRRRRRATCAGCASPTASSSTGSCAGLADLAETYAGGYAHVTTRANLQMREIEPKNAVALIEAIQDLGLVSRGSGADNIRNVTGTPTAGIDPQELHRHAALRRASGTSTSSTTASSTACRASSTSASTAAAPSPCWRTPTTSASRPSQVRDGFGAAPGVWFRLLLGGITGHKDFGRETGVIVRPAEATMVADAVVRVFIDHGDRTDRNKARLKYVLDAMGHRARSSA